MAVDLGHSQQRRSAGHTGAVRQKVACRVEGGGDRLLPARCLVKLGFYPLVGPRLVGVPHAKSRVSRVSWRLPIRSLLRQRFWWSRAPASQRHRFIFCSCGLASARRARVRTSMVASPNIPLRHGHVHERAGRGQSEDGRRIVTWRALRHCSMLAMIRKVS
jgi:hypothetical protein